MADKTFGTCSCGCGDPITHEGSAYAGRDEQERNRHRAKAAYRRKTGDKGPQGTREAMAALGLADDVPVADLADRMAAVAGELARRVAGMDSAAIARQIEQGLAEARSQTETAEKRAADAEAKMLALSEELAAAVTRADQADGDAVEAGQRAEDSEVAFRAEKIRADEASKMHLRAEQDRAEEIRRADRAEALLTETRERLDKVAEETRTRAEAQAAVRVAEARAELTAQIGELRAELATVRAERDGERARAERAEQQMPARRTRAVAGPSTTARPSTTSAAVVPPAAAKPRGRK